MMSLAVKEVFVFSFSVLFLLTDQEQPLRIVLLCVFSLTCWAQYTISQKALLKTLGWAFRNERNCGIVVGGTLVPVTLLATARTITAPTQLHQDYQRGNLLLTTVTILVMMVHSRRSSANFEKRMSLTLILLCLMYYLFKQWNWIYWLSLLLGFLYLEGLVHFLPYSFTIGEAMLVSQALSLLTLDGCCHAVLSLPISPLYACLQVLINGVIVLCMCFGTILMISKYTSGNKKSEKSLKKSPSSSHQWRWTCVFYALTFAVIVFILFPALSYMLGEFVVTWGLKFVFESNIRILLIVSWVIMIAIASLVVYTTESSSTVVRKYFHLIAVAIFVPGILLDLEVVHLASSGAFFIFIILEIIRVFRIEPFGSILHEALSVFVDERDSGIVILTHIYLLLGFSIPVWLYQHVTPTQGLVLFSGVISLGVGDTAASLIGSKYGKHRWSAETVKTIEGTLAAIVSQLVACYILGSMINAFESPYSWMAVTAVVVLTSLLEAFTSQIDNIILPLFMSSLFCALQGRI